MSKPTNNLSSSMQQFQMVMELESLRTEVPKISYSKARAAHITGGNSKMVSKAALFTLALSTGVMMYGNDASAATKDTDKSDQKTKVTQEKSTKKKSTKKTKSSTKKKSKTKKKIEINAKSSSKLKKKSSVDKDLKKTDKTTKTSKQTQPKDETKKTETAKVQEKQKTTTKKTEGTKIVVRSGSKTITTKQPSPKPTTQETTANVTPPKVVTKEVVIPADGQINLDELRANLRKELKLQEKDKLELVVKQQPVVQQPVVQQPVVQQPVVQTPPPAPVVMEPVKTEKPSEPTYQEAPKKKADNPVKKQKWTNKKTASYEKKADKKDYAPVKVDTPEIPTTPISVTPLPENVESRDDQVTLGSIFTSLFETPVEKETETITFSLLSLETSKQDNPGKSEKEHKEDKEDKGNKSEGSETPVSPEVGEDQPDMPEVGGETRDILALEKSILESETPSLSPDAPVTSEPTNETVPPSENILSSNTTIQTPNQNDSLIVQGPSNQSGSNEIVTGGQDVATNQSGKTSTSQDKIGPDAPKTVNGGVLPDTATNDLGTAVLGGSAALAGAIYLTRRQRTRTE